METTVFRTLSSRLCPIVQKTSKTLEIILHTMGLTTVTGLTVPLSDVILATRNVTTAGSQIMKVTVRILNRNLNRY